MEERVLESDRSCSTTPRNLYQYQRPGRVQRATTGFLNMASRNDIYTQHPENVAHRRSSPLPTTIDSGVNEMFSQYESLLEKLLEEGEQLEIVKTTKEVVAKPSSKVEQKFRKENSRAQIQRLKLHKSSIFLPLSPKPWGSISGTVGGVSSFDLTRHLGASDALAAVRHTLNFMLMKNAGCDTTAPDLVRSVWEIRVLQSNNKILPHSRIVNYGDELFSSGKLGSSGNASMNEIFVCRKDRVPRYMYMWGLRKEI